MADDALFPPSKRGKNPRSLGNLRPGVKGEPPRNPTGNNGRTRAETVAAFLEEIDDTDMGRMLLTKVGCPGGTRIRGLLHREWLAGMGKSDLARKTLIEQYAGRPKQQLDLTNSDRSLALAEHMRKVAHDAAELALKVLGSRVYSMTPKELAVFFRDCTGDSESYLKIAKDEIEAREESALDIEATAEPADETPEPETAPDQEWPQP